jgi:hypothetical protein
MAASAVTVLPRSAASSIAKSIGPRKISDVVRGYVAPSGQGCLSRLDCRRTRTVVLKMSGDRLRVDARGIDDGKRPRTEHYCKLIYYDELTDGNLAPGVYPDDGSPQILVENRTA